MTIRINNVGFGEFIELVENDKTILVVDCKKYKGIKLPNTDKILLTHFHADHYSGFISNLNNKVIYLPSLSPKIASIILGSNLLLCLIKKMKIKQSPKISFLLELARHYDSGNVKFLERGNQIRLNSGKYMINVLWPCSQYFNLTQNYIVQLNKLFEEVFSLLRDDKSINEYLM